LFLIGFSEAMTWHLSEEFLHWVHLILAGGIAYLAASHVAAQHAAQHCTRLIATGPCSHASYESVPTSGPSLNIGDLLKDVPILLVGLAVGGAIRLALDHRREVRAVEDQKPSAG
jgi:hypothetical protein